MALFFGATAISRCALNTPTRRGYFALCAQYTALIGYWLSPIRLLSPYLAPYRAQYGLWLRLFRALRSIRLRGAAIGLRQYTARIARYFSPMPDFLDFKGL